MNLAIRWLGFVCLGLAACSAAGPAPTNAPDPGAAAAAPPARTAPPAAVAPAASQPNGATAAGGGLLPQSLGPLQPTPLEIPPGSQAAPFDQSRTLNLPAGFRAQVFASG